MSWDLLRARNALHALNHSSTSETMSPIIVLTHRQSPPATQIKGRKGDKGGNSSTDQTHPHLRASSPSFGPPQAILRRLQNAHAAVVPRLYGRFALGKPFVSWRTGPVGPATTGMRRPDVGEYTNTSSTLNVGVVGGVVGV